MAHSVPLAVAVRRDRAILLAALIGLGGLPCAYMIRMAARTGHGHSCHGMTAPLVRPWGSMVMRKKVLVAVSVLIVIAGL